MADADDDEDQAQAYFAGLDEGFDLGQSAMAEQIFGAMQTEGLYGEEGGLDE